MSTGQAQDHPSAADADLVGRTLTGGLRVQARLGSSPEGPLYQAQYVNGVEVVVLILPPARGGSQPLRRKRLDEATQIQHVNVARMFEVGELADGSLYVVLEPLVGEPLSDLLAAGHVFAPPDALDLTRQAAAGLRAAHRAGFVHGNFSPHAMVVAPASGGRPQVKLVRFTLDPPLSDGGSVPASPRGAAARYASPERLAHDPPDARSDVYSLGAVLHHLLTGMPADAGSVDNSVPEVARAVLGTALAPAPSRRFQTMAEFEAALERLSAVAARPGRRSVRPLVAGAVGTALILVVGAGIALRPDSSGPAAGEEQPRTSSEREAPSASAPLRQAPAGAAPARPAPAATPPARSPPGAASRTPEEAPTARNRPRDTAASSPPTRAVPPASAPTPAGQPVTDTATETGMVSTPPAEEPPALTTQERAQVFLRIGLDEALRQLGRPVHAIEGMTPLFLGLARSRFPPFTDTTRPVVRSVYIGPNESLILLDQQRIRSDSRAGAPTPTSWRMGDVMLYLHGDARPEVLRNLVKRVR